MLKACIPNPLVFTGNCDPSKYVARCNTFAVYNRFLNCILLSVTSFPHDLYISIFAEIVVIDKNLGNHKSGLSKIGRKVQNFKSMVCQSLRKIFLLFICSLQNLKQNTLQFSFSSANPIPSSGCGQRCVSLIWKIWSD